MAAEAARRRAPRRRAQASGSRRYGQQPPPGYAQQPPPGYAQQPPPGSAQQPPPGYAQQPPPGYAQQPAPGGGQQVPPGATAAGGNAPPPGPLGSVVTTDPNQLAAIFAQAAAAGQAMLQTPGAVPGDPVEAGLKLASMKHAAGEQPQGQIAKGTVQEGGHQEFMITMQTGTCYTIIGFSPPGQIKNVDLHLLAPPFYNVMAGQDTSDNNTPVIGATPNPMCPVIPLPLQYKVDITAADRDRGTSASRSSHEVEVSLVSSVHDSPETPGYRSAIASLAFARREAFVCARVQPALASLARSNASGFASWSRSRRSAVSLTLGATYACGAAEPPPAVAPPTTGSAVHPQHGPCS